MNLSLNQSSCAGCPVSRRSVLAAGVAAGCTACFGGLSPFKSTAVAQNSGKKTRVRVIFSMSSAFSSDGETLTGSGWPNIGYDFRPNMAATISELREGCPDIEFLSSPANEAQTAEIIAADNAVGDIDGYIVEQMIFSGGIIGPALDTGKPVISIDFPYGGTGGFLTYGAAMLRAQKPNYAFMSTLRLADLVAAAKCFPIAKGPGGVKAFVEAVTKVRKGIADGARAKTDMSCIEDKVDVLSTSDLLKELKTKKMLCYEGSWPQFIDGAKESLGIDVIPRPFTELNGLWEKADKDQAQEIVKRWKKESVGIIGVPDETLEKSARMYLAQKECLKIHDAVAITINCLSGFYGGAIFAYPCLGFHELLNEGLVGACECDNPSTLTMVVMTAMTKGRPGFISDPFMDVSTKQVVYTHCVATNKVFGPQGPSNPYTIMTHSEDRQGASVRSTLPLGYKTTSLEMRPDAKEILFHQAKAVGNSTDDRACRTKLAAVPVGDYEKLFTEWDRWGWHRVTYYGDLREQIFALGDAVGWKVTEEA